MSERKIQRKWLLVGAVIYGIALLNGLRFIGALPAWVIAVGIAVNLFMVVGFVEIYKSSRPRN